MALRGWGLLLVLTTLVCAQKKSKNKSAPALAKQDTLTWRGAVEPFVKGVVYVSQGLFEEATPYFLRALEQAPDNPAIHYYLAQIAYSQNDYPRMLTHAEKAYREAPQMLWLALGYAAALSLNEEHEAALRLLQKLSKEYPPHPEVLIRLAQAYRRLGRVAEADPIYQKLQERGGILYDNIFQERVQMFVERGRLGQAIALAESMVVRWPRTELYREIAIRLYELARNFPRMATHIEALIMLDASNSMAWEVVLSYLEWFETHWQAVRWDSLLSQPGIPTEVRYNLLVRLCEDGTEVRQRLDQLLREAPTAEGWAFRADLWLEEDDVDSAAHALGEAIRMDSTRWEWWDRWLMLLYRLGGGDSLARSVEAASERFPTQSVLYLWSGIIRMQLGRTQEALTAFRKGWALASDVDTLVARTALYYEGVAYLRAGLPWSDTYRKRLSQYWTPPELLVFRYVMHRGGGQSFPEGEEPALHKALAQLPREHGLRLWAEGLVSPSDGDWQKRIEEAPDQLPLEGWIAILSLGPQALSPVRYQAWRSRALQEYPLCPLWHRLP